ncbi:Phage tail fiber [Vibrio cholerae]|uniref:phage major tropism determinant n=1 Tax=Vibrio cholerae TaxID=666 RepID=UPI000BB53FB2|nr:hypothetical protein [Vibrio cholerae]ATD27096.1 Phage tail fiber [Vibrio cholerae]
MSNPYYQRQEEFDPFTKADGQAVENELDAISAGFDKLPEPRAEGNGFIEPIHVGAATEPTHAVQLQQMSESLGSNEQYALAAQKAASDANTHKLGAESANNSAKNYRDLAESEADRAREEADRAKREADRLRSDVAAQISTVINDAASEADRAQSEANRAKSISDNLAMSGAQVIQQEVVNALPQIQAEVQRATDEANRSGASADRAQQIQQQIEQSYPDATEALPNIAVLKVGHLAKTIPNEQAFKLFGQDIRVNGDIYLELLGKLEKISSGTLVPVDPLSLDGAYYIYYTNDGLVVSSNAQSPVGHSTSTSRKIGGFYRQGSQNKHLYDLVINEFYREQQQRFSLLTAKSFNKSSEHEPAFMVSGGLLKTACNIAVIVDGQLLTFGANETITTPTLLVGVDYAIYATADGLIVSSNFTFPAGYNADNSRRIGGFHYGNNEFKSYSFYDLNFRPQCKDPRGMVIDISGSSFWADIYLLNTTPDALGTSAYNATIADGASPPKIPAKWGGNGTSQYANFTQYIATEVLAAFGKRLPNAHEFSVLAQGSVTGHVASVDPVTTKFDASARSLIGCEQVSGHMWQWGSEQWDRGNGSSGYAWYAAETNGKGSVYSALGSEGVGASVFGGGWDLSVRAGSRCSDWRYVPWTSYGSFAARGVCDHLQLG